MRLTISTLHDLAYEQGHNEGLALEDFAPEDLDTAQAIDTHACHTDATVDLALEAVIA